MKKIYPSLKRELTFVSLLLLATQLVCPSVNAMDLVMNEVPFSQVESQQSLIEPRDQVLFDFITKHAPGKFNLTGKDRKDLESYAHEIIVKDPKYDAHTSGGPLGKEFFSLMQPVGLEELCEQIRQIKASLPKKADVFNEKIIDVFNKLLNTMGQERGNMAQITGTRNAELFGSRNFTSDNPGLMVGLDKNDLWYQLLKAKVQKITQDIDLSLLPALLCIKGSLNIHHDNVVLEVMSDEVGYGIYLRHKGDEPFFHAFEPHPFPRSGDRSIAYYWVLGNPNFNLSSLFPSDENEIIYCYHKPGIAEPALASQEILSCSLNNFKNLLYWDGSFVNGKGEPINDLVIGHFASLLWKMSHSSIYERGQEAITKRFLGALAKVNGYELKFCDQGDAVTEDMQAMLELDREKFVKDWVAHGFIKLEKIRDQNLSNPSEAPKQ